MTDWDAIRYFLEVARTQRASAAAQRLGVRHSTVTRRMCPAGCATASHG